MLLLRCFIPILIVILFIQDISAYHQNDYNIVHNRLVLEDYNPHVLANPKIAVVKYNRTTPDKALNLSATFLVDIKSNEIILAAAMYKFASNEYRPFPLNISISFCEEYKKNTFGMQSANNFTNFRGCPTPKGYYYLAYYLLEQDQFPPYIPGGEYRLLIQLSLGNVFFARASWYGSIVPKLNLWKN